MKPKILKLSALVLLLLFIGASCQKDEFEYADENIEVYSSPGISIYKTKGDFFNNITLGLNANKEISSYPDYHEKSENVLVNKNGDCSFKYKWLLKSGYIVERGGDFNRAVTNISLTEYINFNEPFKTNWDSEMLASRIIDRDPFLTYYHLNGLYQGEKKFTLGELNDMIENGTIEEQFTKLK